MGQPARGPRPGFKAVLVFALPGRALGGTGTSPGLGQIGALGAAVHGRGQDVTSPVLQAGAARLAATRPGGEVRDHAVLRAGDETRLLHGRLRREELAYPRGDGGTVGGACAVHVAPLDAVLCRDAVGRPRCRRQLVVGEEGDECAAAPVRHLPPEEVLVPVAHLEAAPLHFRLVSVLAVAVVGRPALRVDAPRRPRLGPGGAALLSHALAPLTCKNGKNAQIYIYLFFFNNNNNNKFFLNKG